MPRYVAKTDDGVFQVRAISSAQSVLFTFAVSDDVLPTLQGFMVTKSTQIDGEENDDDDDISTSEAMDSLDNIEDAFQSLRVNEDSKNRLPMDAWKTATRAERSVIKSFTWSDYAPSTKGVYEIAAHFKNNRKLSLSISVTLESSKAVMFNRGACGSQAYTKRFGNKSPTSLLPDRSAFVYLSRGTEETLLEFVQDAAKIYVATYEMDYVPFAEMLQSVRKAGTDVRILYDANNTEKGTGEILKQCGLFDVSVARKKGTGLSHHKFIIRIAKDGTRAVLTGSMNFTNVGVQFLMYFVFLIALQISSREGYLVKATP
jgi:hypothetical protein